MQRRPLAEADGSLQKWRSKFRSFLPEEEVLANSIFMYEDYQLSPYQNKMLIHLLLEDNPVYTVIPEWQNLFIITRRTLSVYGQSTWVLMLRAAL